MTANWEAPETWRDALRTLPIPLGLKSALRIDWRGEVDGVVLYAPCQFVQLLLEPSWKPRTAIMLTSYFLYSWEWRPFEETSPNFGEWKFHRFRKRWNNELPTIRVGYSRNNRHGLPGPRIWIQYADKYRHQPVRNLGITQIELWLFLIETLTQWWIPIGSEKGHWSYIQVAQKNRFPSWLVLKRALEGNLDLGDQGE